MFQDLTPQAAPGSKGHTPDDLQLVESLLTQSLTLKGYVFLQSKWLIATGSASSMEQAVLHYLKSSNIRYSLIEQVSQSESGRLPDSALCILKLDQIQLASALKALPIEARPGILKAILIEANTTQSPAVPTQTLLEFWRKLRQAHWLMDALRDSYPHKKTIIAASILINFLALAPSLFVIQIYDRIIPNQAYSSLWALALGLLICLGFDSLLKRSRHSLMEHSATVCDTLCTQKLSAALLATRQHNTTPSGLLQHLRSFEHLREIITGVFLVSVIDLPFLFLFLAVIGLIHPYFLFIAAAVTIIHLVEVLRVHSHLVQLGQQQLEEYRNAQGDWIDSLQQLPTIQGHGAQSLFTARLDKNQIRHRLSGNEIRERSMNSSLNMQLLQQVAWAGSIILGVYLVVENALTTGGLIAVSMLMMRCFSPLQRLQSQLVQSHAAQAGFEDLNRLMTQRPPPPGNPQGLQAVQHVELNQVSSKTPASPSGKSGKALLNTVTLEWQAGARVGVIGPNGSGKTSLLNLLAGQIDVTEGEYTLNHIRHSLFAEEEKGRHLGFSEQPPRLIRGTLMENITLHRPWIKPEDCTRIIAQLGLQGWINSLPEGLNHPVQSQGSNLSSGQKQLVALCRALCGQPELILLDEPTVCLDTKTESMLIQYLSQLPKQVTLVLTTHRLNLLACCQQLILMNQGQIIQQGDKATVLMAAKNLEQHT